ncbi:hypothetical protein QQX98_000516 [Neonectria punicea]|uniref:Uncharacterized protein n=1 Tax=Neonectria punicea TaxID=979145 RepID=A0ABR1HU63_9HYPO
MAKPEQPRRRFAPVPIETTFESFRQSGKQKHVIHHNQPRELHCDTQNIVRMGPNPEPTPEPSPRSPSPVPRELQPRRRFAPQLIETSRRSRRVGDVGPATKPTDKTDISPYTRNIYNTKQHRSRKHDGRGHGDNASPLPRPLEPTRRESEDENVTRYLLELAAKEAERQMQETALQAFPNSHAREGGIDHFYFRESSGSDNSPESTSPARNDSGHGRPRRSSSGQDMGWWQKHMQEHVEHIAHDQDEMVVDEPEPQHDFKYDFKHAEMDAVLEVETESDSDGQGDSVMRTDSALDRMDLSVPPDPMWTTSKKVSTPDTHGPIGESLMPLIQPDPYVTSQTRDKAFLPAPAPPRPIGESPMPYVPSPAVKPADFPYAKPSQIPPDTSFRNQAGPFGRPFGGLGYKPPTPLFQKRRPAVSPPMLGKDLVFRRCPSPKQTKLEPDHPFADRHAEERYRDVSGQKGLWRGYCYRSESNEEYLVPADLHAPHMLGTLQPPATPGYPGVAHFAHFDMGMRDEPAFLDSSTADDEDLDAAELRGRSREPQGLHVLHGFRGIDRRLQKQNNLAELDDKISQEFDDTFVTQVYNYLSLGYPAMARSYDEELSQISLMSISDLEKDDAKQLAQGHLVEAEDLTPREQRCPRWKALRSYITEWARQHPDLDNLDPMAWGVRERRGSWAI